MDLTINENTVYTVFNKNKLYVAKMGVDHNGNMLLIPVIDNINMPKDSQINTDKDGHYIASLDGRFLVILEANDQDYTFDPKIVNVGYWHYYDAQKGNKWMYDENGYIYVNDKGQKYFLQKCTPAEPNRYYKFVIDSDTNSQGVSGATAPLSNSLGNDNTNYQGVSGATARPLRQKHPDNLCCRYPPCPRPSLSHQHSSLF